MDNKPTAKDFTIKLEQRQNALIRLLQTADGSHAVDFLIAKYGGDVQVNGDPYATHVRIGERNVVDYLKELQGANNA